MRIPRALFLALSVVLPMSPAGAAGLKQIGAIALPFASNQFNSTSVDQAAQLYFLPDRTNGALDIIDLKSETFALRIPGFTGITDSGDTYGPDAAVMSGPNEIWVSDGDSSVKIVDLKAKKIVATVHTGGKKRVNELAYDPKDRIVIAENSDDSPPFLTLISTEPARKIAGNIPMPMAATNLERIVYYPATDRFFVDVPAIAGQIDHGAIAEIDPKTAALAGLHPVPDCNPHGLSPVSGSLFFVGCGMNAMENPHPAVHVALFDTKTNKVTAYIAGIVGAGETAVDVAAKRFYVAANNDPKGPALGVIDARTNTLLQRIPTWTGSHTVAVNPKNGHVFVATRANSGPCGGCVLIYAPE